MKTKQGNSVTASTETPSWRAARTTVSMSAPRSKSWPTTPGTSRTWTAGLPVSKVSSRSTRHSRTGAKRLLSSELR